MRSSANSPLSPLTVPSIESDVIITGEIEESGIWEASLDTNIFGLDWENGVEMLDCHDMNISNITPSEKALSIIDLSSIVALNPCSEHILLLLISNIVTAAMFILAMFSTSNRFLPQPPDLLSDCAQVSEKVPDEGNIDPAILEKLAEEGPEAFEGPPASVQSPRTTAIRIPVTCEDRPHMKLQKDSSSTLETVNRLQDLTALSYKADIQKLLEQESRLHDQIQVLHESFTTCRSDNDTLRAECEEWKHKWAIANSRCRMLELEKDKHLWQEAKIKREQAEKEQTAQEAKWRHWMEVEESERRMRQMREQERIREEEGGKQKQREEAERKAREQREDEARNIAQRVEGEERMTREKMEKKRKAQEKRAQRVRMDAWRAASDNEEQRRCFEDLELWKLGWTDKRAFDRFIALLKIFEDTLFTEEVPLTKWTVPWPILSSPVNISKPSIEWSDVEIFFEFVKTQITDHEEYIKLLGRVQRTFHPDKWCSRGILNSVVDEEKRRMIKEWGNTVSQTVTPLWRTAGAAKK